MRGRGMYYLRRDKLYPQRYAWDVIFHGDDCSDVRGSDIFLPQVWEGLIKNKKQMMVQEKLMRPRRIMIADWPTTNFLVGDVFTFEKTFDFEPLDGQTEVWYDEKNNVFMDTLDKYPHLFRKLEWWEERTIEEMQAVKYVKVIKYRGYWREGDIVKVEYFDAGSIERATPYSYVLKYNHIQPVFELLPATESEYNRYTNSKHFNHTL